MMQHADIFGLLLTLILGLGWGSYATMAVYRIPRGMPWVGDKPRCLLCKHELNIIDYFSIISYFLWRGTCRYCKGKFECNVGYLFTELAITLGFLLCYMQYGFGDLFVLLTLLIVLCVVIAVVDAEHQFIPSKFLISALLLGAIYRTFVDGTFYGALYGGITGGVSGIIIRHIFFAFRKEKDIGWDYTKWQHEDRFKGPGFDYVKMLAIVGVFLPLLHFAFYLIYIGSFIILWRLIHKKSCRIGAIMVFGLAFYILYPGVIDYFLGILGVL